MIIPGYLRHYESVNRWQYNRTFDTTLRDETQGEGINLSVDDKLHIAKQLDDLESRLLNVAGLEIIANQPLMFRKIL